MSSGSVSASDSFSESCCIPSTCACETWLTAFCDYQTVTFDYCDEKTVFNFARSSDLPVSSVTPQSGLLPQDRVFRLSMLENTVAVGIGAVITDEDDVEWAVLLVESLDAFCVKKLTSRSVAACFQLLDWIEVFEQDCDCEDCGQNIRYKRVGRVKGRILAETGSLTGRNDSNDLVYQHTGNLVRWPLRDKPSSSHRVRDKNGTYRISRVRDGGPFVPFVIGLEQEDADCSVRGSQ